MSIQHKLVQMFSKFKGLDLRSSDLTRSSQFATDMENAEYRKTGAISKRKGYQYRTKSIGGAGLDIYADIDKETGVITEKVVCLDENLHILTEQSLDITYSGTEPAYVNVLLDPDDSNFYIQLYENNIQVLDYNMGKGIKDLSPTLTLEAVTAINAVADFSATITDDGADAGAFLDLTFNLNLEPTGSIKYYTWTIPNSPVVEPFTTHQSHKNNDDFENASFANLNNTLYISTGYEDLYKYDGQTLYRAGMPKADTPTPVLGAFMGITNSDTKYIVTHLQKDAKGNIIEGIESDATTGIALTDQSIELTVNNIESDSGFNTGCAITVGIQNAVNTITVDDGSGGNHTLLVGDVAYLYDNSTSEHVERNITAVDATSITIDGDPVDILDNEVISHNLRILIYRNQNAGSTYQLVAEIPNNSFDIDQLYLDSKPDAELGFEYVQPIKEHGLPPKGKYITVYRSQLIITGEITDVNNVRYSDIDGPEFFPAASNAFLVDNIKGDKISGVAPSGNSLVVFKEDSIYIVEGDLAEDKFRVDLFKRSDIGCVAHHTIHEVRGSLMFLSKKGIYSITPASGEYLEMSEMIEPLFTETSKQYNLKKAVARNWVAQDKYVLLVPVEGEDATGNKYFDDDSDIFVFDYFRGAWLVWNCMNMLGGMVVHEGKMAFTARRFDVITGNIENNYGRTRDQSFRSDYADHDEAITFQYKTHWEALGEPSIFKKYLRLKVHASDASINDFESEEFTLDVKTEKDYIPSPDSQFTLDFSGGAEGWGLSEWGAFAWGDSRLPSVKSKLKSGKAKSLRLIYENNTIKENVLISGFELEIAAPYNPTIKE